MQTDMILDAFVVDVEPPAVVRPAQEYVWLREVATGEEVCFPAEMENAIGIMLQTGYRIFVPSEVKHEVS